MLREVSKGNGGKSLKSKLSESDLGREYLEKLLSQGKQMLRKHMNYYSITVM